MNKLALKERFFTAGICSLSIHALALLLLFSNSKSETFPDSFAPVSRIQATITKIKGEKKQEQAIISHSDKPQKPGQKEVTGTFNQKVRKKEVLSGISGHDKSGSIPESSGENSENISSQNSSNQAAGNGKESNGIDHTGSQADSDSNELYLGLLRNKIEQAVEYPSALSGTGASGKVIVQITIDKDGALLDSRVIVSSDEPIFDRSALKAVKNASPLPPPPVNVFTVQIPVVFKSNMGYK
jgi:protein TonB